MIFCRTFSLLPESVLELPSEGWSETSDGWFCHQHEEGTHDHSCGSDVKTCSSNLPKDCNIFNCFVGNNVCLVSPSLFVNNSIKVSQSNSTSSILCARCQSNIGVFENTILLGNFANYIL